jgi:hypothetical protein
MKSAVKQREKTSLLKVIDVPIDQQMVVENWLVEIILHISKRNEVFGVPVILCYTTIHAIVGLLCYFFNVESKLHSSEGGDKKYITKKGVSKETSSAFETQWTKQFFHVVFGCPEERLTEPPVKQCHNRDLSGGLLFY